MDLQAMMQQAQALQEKMEALKEEAAKQTATGTAGGGMVTVTMNGRNEVLEVKIDPQVLQTPDVEMLQDLVAAAVNQAVARVQEKMQTELAKAAGSLPIPPGLF